MTPRERSILVAGSGVVLALFGFFMAIRTLTAPEESVTSADGQFIENQGSDVATDSPASTSGAEGRAGAGADLILLADSKLSPQDALLAGSPGKLELVLIGGQPRLASRLFGLPASLPTIAAGGRV